MTSWSSDSGSVIPWPSVETGNISPTNSSFQAVDADAASGGAPVSMCGCAACIGDGGSDAAPQVVEPPVAAAASEDGGTAAASDAAAAGPQLAFNAPTAYVDALLNEYDLRWGGSNSAGSPVTITYSFLTSVPSYYSSNADERDGFEAMNALQKTAVREMLQTFADVANITFTEVSGVGAMTFGIADLGQGIAGWAYYPGFSGTTDKSVAGDVWITNRYSDYANPIKGTWEYNAFIHEIGHALGLKHPGDYNAGGGGTGGPYLPANTDSHQYTVMSYYSGASYNGEPITPQLYDVAALQYLYGANATTRSGNSTYTTDATIKTIWDGGGTDVINGGGYGGNQRIDLVAGNFSSLNGATNNWAIGYNVTIENATGGSGSDTLIGNGAVNTLTGQSGNDSLDGRADADILIGGLGNDTYYADNAGDKITELSGQGTDLVNSRASITLSDNVENLTLVAGAGAIDGTGNALANVITGNESANRLTGEDGADRLTGKGGADVFVLGHDDTGLAAAARDIITDFAIGQDLLDLIGIDGDSGTAIDDSFSFLGATAFTGIAGQLHYRYDASRGATVLEGDVNGDLLADFALELLGNLTLTNTNFVTGSLRVPNALNLTGTSGSDTLVGEELNDTLSGLDGDDTLNGGGGLDTLVGGDGNDTYVVGNTGVTISESAGQGSADRIVASVSYALGADIENLTLTGADSINGTGNELANKITGNSAQNILSGLDGDDLINGGGGNDTLVGGAGNDTYVIGNSGATVTELAGQGDADTVLTSFGLTLGANLENLVLTGTGAINGTGNSSANTISGNNAANTINGGAGDDILDGGLGNDVLIGGAGADNISGGGGIDTASYAPDTAGVTVSLMIGFSDNGQAEGDSLTGITNLTGGLGNDTLEGDGGNNVLNGGAGTDTLSYKHSLDSVTVSLLTTTAQNTVGAGVDTLSNFENLIGSAGDDVLMGSAVNNILSGLDGDDRINGGAGNDRMIGGAGDDTYFVSQSGDLVIEAAGEGSTDIVFSLVSYTLAAEVENLTLNGTAAINGTGNVLDNIIVGNPAANTLSGGLGNDKIDGGLGTDTLNGGGGNDILTGGAGNDVFRFLSVFGTDTVTDFVRGQDDIDVSRSVFGTWADLFARTADDGFGNAVISAGVDHAIVLVGIAKADLLATDFHLV